MTKEAAQPSAQRIVTLFAIYSALSVAVIFWTLLPPLNDYPNHLGRVHILANLASSEVLQRYYRNVMSAQPNLAMDIIIPALANVMPLELAGKIFIALTVMLTAGGTFALHFAIHRRTSVWPFLSFLFVYHRMMLWGLLNFCFGVGLMLVGLAVWIAIRDKSIWLRIPLSVAMAAAVYLSHLYAFGIYCIGMAGIELWYLFAEAPLSRKLKDVVVAGIQFVLPLYFFLFLSGTPASVSETRWGTIWRKFEAPFDVIYQYHLVFDVGFLLFLAALVLWGLWIRRISFAMRMLPTLVLLTIVYLAMPDELFTGYGADRRLPIAILLIFIAACDWRPARALWREPVVLLLTGLFVLRMALLMIVWHRSDAIYSQYFQAFDKLPRGAKVLPYTIQTSTQSLEPIPTLEIAPLAIVRRDAFVPSLFTSPPLSAESVSFAPEVLKLGVATHFHITLAKDIPNRQKPGSKTLRKILGPDVVNQFDYVVLTAPQVLPKGAIPGNLKPVYRGSDFVLLKVEPRG